MIDDGDLGSRLHKRDWWKSLDEKEARDPLGAIYDAQKSRDESKKVADAASKSAQEWEARVEFLQSVARNRMGH